MGIFFMKNSKVVEKTLFSFYSGALNKHARHAKVQSAATFCSGAMPGHRCHYTVIDLVSSSLSRVTVLVQTSDIGNKTVPVRVQTDPQK